MKDRRRIDVRAQVGWIVGKMLLICGVAAIARAADVPSSYKPLRYDDNFIYLRDPARGNDFWDPIKYIPLGSPDTYLTLGGELRERLDHFRNPVFGLSHHRASLDDVLQRVLLNADVHAGPHFRAFVQLGNHVAAGKGDLTGPTDVDRLDLQQGFVDLMAPVAGGSFTLRAGRQEMSFGSQRLISVREPPNVRRSFDGVRATYEAGGARVDAFLTKPVKDKEGLFDDEPDPAQNFWGVYSTSPVGPVAGLHADFYYLGFEHRHAFFAEGSGHEIRQTLGTRLWGRAGRWDYDTEFTGQGGHFDRQDIRAWAISSDTGYTAAGLPLTPRFGLKANIASGNHNPASGTLGTFNPLFPKLGYFTEAELVIESNLIDVYPSLAIHPAPGLTVSVGGDVLWRESVHDGFYEAPFVPLIRGPGASGQASVVPLTPTAGHTGRYIGTEAQLFLDWQANRHIDVVAAYVHFAAGPTLTAAGGKSVDFAGTRVAYQF